MPEQAKNPVECIIALAQEGRRMRPDINWGRGRLHSSKNNCCCFLGFVGIALGVPLEEMQDERKENEMNDQQAISRVTNAYHHIHDSMAEQCEFDKNQISPARFFNINDNHNLANWEEVLKFMKGQLSGRIRN